MQQEVKMAMSLVRDGLLARGSDVELLRTTDLGAVHVSLSGECCTGSLKRLLTILDIEDAIKKLVPDVRIVVDCR